MYFYLEKHCKVFILAVVQYWRVSSTPEPPAQYWFRLHKENMQTPHLWIKPRTFSLWDNSASHLTTMLLVSVKFYSKMQTFANIVTYHLQNSHYARDRIC